MTINIALKGRVRTLGIVYLKWAWIVEKGADRQGVLHHRSNHNMTTPVVLVTGASRGVIRLFLEWT